jgi:NAD(P)-dependent dehydrogenase (short-subunit alcohol dehydrogenase family)
MARRAMEGLSDEEIAALRDRRRMTVLLETEGTAWDAANAALFFASEDSRWITGQDLAVDGGFMLAGNPADPAYERGKPQLLK